MKKVIFLFALFISFTAFSQNDIVGIWNTEKENSIVEVYEYRGELFGKIISSDQPGVVGKSI